MAVGVITLFRGFLILFDLTLNDIVGGALADTNDGQHNISDEMVIIIPTQGGVLFPV